MSLLNRNSTVLGFDHGKRKIGVAVGQLLTATATPLRVVHAVKQKPDWQTLDKLCKEWQPGGLVVGLPIREDGTDSHSTQAARAFMQQLKKRYTLPVFGVNEYLSSHEASQRVDGELDAVAAQVILETWLTDYDNTE